MVPACLSEIKTASLWLAVGAEFLGTFLLVVFGCGSCGADGAVISIALGFGLTVATIVWAIGHVSGGHINPAVTFGFLVTRKITLLKAFLYVNAQCLGAILGAVILQVTYANSNHPLNLCNTFCAVSYFAGFLVEALITFILVFVVFATCDSLRKGYYGSGPLSIGLSVSIGHIWAIKFTGAGTNPARVFGPAVIAGSFDNHWIYWVGPLVGGALAALLYDLAFAENSCRDKVKAFFTSRNYDDADYSNDGGNIIQLMKEAPDVKTASV